MLSDSYSLQICVPSVTIQVNTNQRKIPTTSANDVGVVMPKYPEAVAAIAKMLSRLQVRQGIRVHPVSGGSKTLN